MDFRASLNKWARIYNRNKSGNRRSTSRERHSKKNETILDKIAMSDPTGAI